MIRAAPLAAAALLAGCGNDAVDPRGVERAETLLSVSATGEADAAPDEARFTAGIENFAASAQAATQATSEDIAAIVAALRALGIEERDIQTSSFGVQRIGWGDRRGQYQASNTVIVRVRDIDAAGAAVAAVAETGANILSGPELRLSDPEAAANTAYADAYRAARRRAEAYAEAAGMKIGRVLYIRDAGGSQGHRWLPGAEVRAQAQDAAAPPPTVAPPPPPEQGGGATIMPGQTISSVAVQVDFALVPA